jgi:hypothetical protein
MVSAISYLNHLNVVKGEHPLAHSRYDDPVRPQKAFNCVIDVLVHSFIAAAVFVEVGRF